MTTDCSILVTMLAVKLYGVCLFQQWLLTGAVRFSRWIRMRNFMRCTQWYIYTPGVFHVTPRLYVHARSSGGCVYSKRGFAHHLGSRSSETVHSAHHRLCCLHAFVVLPSIANKRALITRAVWRFRRSLEHAGHQHPNMFAHRST